MTADRIGGGGGGPLQTNSFLPEKKKMYVILWPSKCHHYLYIMVIKYLHLKYIYMYMYIYISNICPVLKKFIWF